MRSLFKRAAILHTYVTPNELSPWYRWFNQRLIGRIKQIIQINDTLEINLIRRACTLAAAAAADKKATSSQSPAWFDALILFLHVLESEREGLMALIKPCTFEWTPNGGTGAAPSTTFGSLCRRAYNNYIHLLCCTLTSLVCSADAHGVYIKMRNSVRRAREFHPRCQIFTPFHPSRTN